MNSSSNIIPLGSCYEKFILKGYDYLSPPTRTMNELFGLPPVKGVNPIDTDVDDEIDKLSEILDYDTLLRFGYVPFVIAEVAWDFADTVINLAIINRQHSTKKLCRILRELRKEYLRMKQSVLDEAHLNSEQKNMETFEDELNDYFHKLYSTNVDELLNEYPNIDEDRRMMIAESYLCYFVLQALFRYTSNISAKVAKAVGHPIGNILPDELRKLSKEIIKFAEDCPINSEIMTSKESFVSELVNYINDIELYEDEKAIPRIVE